MMVIAQHKPPAEVTYQERTVTRELQDRLDAADASRSPELRQRFPVVAYDETKSQYPDQWIALLPTHVDGHNRLIAGRLIAHARDWAPFKSAVESFRHEFPGSFPFTYFTGGRVPGRV